jgi:hypothetical protein
VRNSPKNLSRICYSYQFYDRIISDYTLRGFFGNPLNDNNFYNSRYPNSDRQNRYDRFKRLERYDRQNYYKYDIKLRSFKSIRRFKLSDIQIYDGTNNVHLFMRRITSMINHYKINNILQIFFLYFEDNART